MTRIRLRDARPEGEAAFYAERYPAGYQHDCWPDHVERVASSVEMIRRYASQIRTAADLSCGDAAILSQLPDLEAAWLGDLNGVPRSDPEGLTAEEIYPLPPAPLPDSLTYLPDNEIDLFILSETLEHMDDPDDLLLKLARVSRYLFVSTPVDESEESGNLEHYWSWGTGDVYDMLTAAGWQPLERQILVPQSTLDLPHAYHYQLWLAVRR